MLSAKCRPFCLGLNVLAYILECTCVAIYQIESLHWIHNFLQADSMWAWMLDCVIGDRSVGIYMYTK